MRKCSCFFEFVKDIFTTTWDRLDLLFKSVFSHLRISKHSISFAMPSDSSSSFGSSKERIFPIFLRTLNKSNMPCYSNSMRHIFWAFLIFERFLVDVINSIFYQTRSIVIAENCVCLAGARPSVCEKYDGSNKRIFQLWLQKLLENFFGVVTFTKNIFIWSKFFLTNAPQIALRHVRTIELGSF